MTIRRTASRPLYEIAEDIRRNWGNVYFGAVPYLEAMFALDSMDDMYGMDDARSIVAYFLSNATTWRGEDARRIKAELNSMLKTGKTASRVANSGDDFTDSTKTAYTLTEWSVSVTSPNRWMSTPGVWDGAPNAILNVHKTVDEPNEFGGIGKSVKHPEYDGLTFDSVDEAWAFAESKGLVSKRGSKTAEYDWDSNPQGRDREHYFCAECGVEGTYENQLRLLPSGRRVCRDCEVYRGVKAKRKTAGVFLTDVALENAWGDLSQGAVGRGIDPNGNEVRFRLSPEDAADLRSIMVSDLAMNFSGVTVDESDIISEARRKTAGLPTYPPGTAPARDQASLDAAQVGQRYEYTALDSDGWAGVREGELRSKDYAGTGQWWFTNILEMFFPDENMLRADPVGTHTAKRKTAADVWVGWGDDWVPFNYAQKDHEPDAGSFIGTMSTCRICKGTVIRDQDASGRYIDRWVHVQAEKEARRRALNEQSGYAESDLDDVEVTDDNADEEPMFPWEIKESPEEEVREAGLNVWAQNGFEPGESDPPHVEVTDPQAQESMFDEGWAEQGIPWESATIEDTDTEGTSKTAKRKVAQWIQVDDGWYADSMVHPNYYAVVMDFEGQFVWTVFHVDESSEDNREVARGTAPDLAGAKQEARAAMEGIALGRKRKTAWTAPKSEYSGACADGDHDACRMDHLPGDICLCTHSSHGVNAPQGFKPDAYNDMSGACADGDHAACQMTHADISAYCLCPQHREGSGTFGRRKNKTAQWVEQIDPWGLPVFTAGEAQVWPNDEGWQWKAGSVEGAASTLEEAQAKALAQLS